MISILTYFNIAHLLRTMGDNLGMKMIQITGMQNYTHFVSFVTYFMSKFICLGHQQQYLRKNIPVGTPEKELAGDHFLKG